VCSSQGLLVHERFCILPSAPVVKDLSNTFEFITTPWTALEKLNWGGKAERTEDIVARMFDFRDKHQSHHHATTSPSSRQVFCFRELEAISEGVSEDMRRQLLYIVSFENRLR
jgi:hypothetical protein